MPNEVSQVIMKDSTYGHDTRQRHAYEHRKQEHSRANGRVVQSDLEELREVEKLRIEYHPAIEQESVTSRDIRAKCDRTITP